jgi:hypothetical protein
MTRPQCMTALDRANEIRLARCDAKHRIFAGELSVADALSLGCCQTMTVFELLCSQYRYGRLTTLRVLNRLRIGEARTVGGLTERQRRQIAAACSRGRKAA